MGLTHKFIIIIASIKYEIAYIIQFEHNLNTDPNRC